MTSKYYDADRIDGLVAEHRHRVVIGGLWEELGELQLTTLRQMNLKPHNSVLDVGCGSLRLGSKLVAFLEPNKYFGTDLNASLLDAGYERELPPELKSKLDRANLVAHDATQTLPFEQQFDYLVAFSLFTHLNLEQSTLVIRSIAERMHERSQLLATFFVAPGDPNVASEQLKGIVTYPDKDPFHLTVEQIDALARSADLSAEALDHVSHPRGQTLYKMCSK
ncbi:MAG: class I SAM-dependent methyltransferase [Henriciella sp.]